MSILIELREHRSIDVDLTAAMANALATAAGSKLTVGASGRPGWWTVTATNHVGSIVLPDVRVLIRPKVTLENLLLLVDAGMPPEGWRPEVFGFGSHRELLPAFAAFFARTVDQLTARGLLRSYRAEQDRLVALRGRIDFSEQLRRPALPSPIACAFDEYTADVPENRFLLGAVDKLLRTVGVDPRTRSLLQHARGRFEDVTSTLPTVDQIDQISYSRLNEHYRPALRL